MLVAGCSKSPWKGPKQVVFRTPDGLRLMGTLWLPRQGPSPAVLMVANPEQDRKVFRPLAEQLAVRGIAALALDLRIQGESLRANQLADPLSPEHLKHLLDDVRYVFEEMRRARYSDPARLGLVACADNSEVTLRALLGKEALRAVALLSPVLSDSTYGHLVNTRLPVFAVSSYDDPGGAPLSRRIGEESRSPDTRFKIYYAVGRGSDMLWSPEGSDIVRRLVTWFAQVLEVPAE